MANMETYFTLLGWVMDSLTEEQKALVEQYQHVPIWLVTRHMGLTSVPVYHALKKATTVEDLVGHLQLSVIRAVQSYNPDRGMNLKSWIIRLCRQDLIALSRSNAKDLHNLKVFESVTDKDLYIIEDNKEGFLDNIEAPLHVLTPKQRRVLMLRFYAKLTLKEIGDKLGYTKERIRQIEAKALERLKIYIMKDGECKNG